MVLGRTGKARAIFFCCNESLYVFRLLVGKAKDCCSGGDGYTATFDLDDEYTIIRAI